MSEKNKTEKLREGRREWGKQKKEKREKNEAVAFRVALINMFLNMFLSAIKLASGIMAHSDALVSDALHSISDVFATLIVILGIFFSRKEADKEHPYGHERLECIAAMVLGGIIFLTGAGIGREGIKKVADLYHGVQAEAPGMAALIVAAVSIGIKEWMYRFGIRTAERVGVSALRADAWHNRADALATAGALAGIGCAMMGFPVMDSIACVFISVCVIKAAVEILRDAVGKIIDKACDDHTEEKMKALILEQQGVLGINELHTRLFGSRIYVDVEIVADGSISLENAHEIAENVHLAMEEKFPGVKHCMVHMDPFCKANCSNG